MENRVYIDPITPEENEKTQREYAKYVEKWQREERKKAEYQQWLLEKSQDVTIGPVTKFICVLIFFAIKIFVVACAWTMAGPTYGWIAVAMVLAFSVYDWKDLNRPD